MMVKYISFMIILGVSLLFTSCVYHFDLDEAEGIPKLVVYSYPGSGDTTVVRLSRSLPVTGKGEIVSGLTGTDVRLEVNGTSVGLLWTDKALPGVPAKSYYTVQRYEEGDCIRLTASAEGLETVSSVTTIPVPFPLNSVHMERKPSDPGTLQFQINFTDEASTVNYYAVTVKERAKYWRNGESRVYYDKEYTAYMDWDDEPLLRVSAGLDEILIGDYTYYEQLYIWSDEKIQGKNYTLRLNKTYISDYETSIQDEVYINRKQYKVCLYSLSEEFYHYLKSMNEQVNNKLGESELAPVRPTYTNVTNGLGLVGGCRMIQTEWMDSVEE